MGDPFADALRQIFLDPTVLGTILLAAVYGIFMGAVPGLTATMAVALLVPLAFKLPAIHAMAAVVTLEACAIFAGDIPCALVRIPGTPSSAAYTDDMYAHGRAGRSDRVLGLSLVLGVIGGLFGALALILFARPLAEATSFRTSDYFWFYLLGLGCAVAVSRGSPMRGAVGLILGLLLSTVGLSPVHVEPRFTFGRPELLQGINLIPAMIGLFGLSEILRNALAGVSDAPRVAGRAKGPGSWGRAIDSVFGGTFREAWRRKFAMLRSNAIGTVIGMLPGAGADIAAWVSYGVSKRFSKKPEEYGRGSLEGMGDATAANNAALAGAWVPTLVFGIPGDSVTAIVIGILMMKNLKPGPDIFEKQGALVWGIYIVFILANLLLLPIGFLAIKAGGWLIRVPRRILLPVILLFCLLGAYAINSSFFDVGIMLAMGLLGFALERRQIPLGPVVLGLVLGGPLEERFVQTMMRSAGGFGAFFERPLSFALAGACALMWLAPIGAALRRLRARATSRSTPPPSGPAPA